MDDDKIKDLFEEKYEEALGLSYQEWLESAPQTEDQAYQRCIEIDELLNDSYDEWFAASGDKKEELEEQRQKWKLEYDLLEELFHLDFEDRSW